MPRNATPSKPKPKAKAKPTVKKPASKPAGKAAAKKPTPKSAVKKPSKPLPTPAKKATGKSISKPTSKPISTAAAKTTVKSETKQATKPVAARGTKVDPKVAKSAALSGSKPDAGKPKPSMNGTAAVSKPADAVKNSTDPKGDGKSGRKGITIVTPKPMKRSRPKVVTAPTPPGVGGLMSKLGPARKPLISSGPKAAHSVPLGSHHAPHAVEAPKPDLRTPYKKPELQKFKAILLRKRDELIGDINTMENEALKGESGSLSNLPQHIAEQGSETYEQSLALDLAAADRKLLKEIDEALRRIENGTYGVCELTGKPIKPERLEELPWARHSIEAARELERRNIRA